MLECLLFIRLLHHRGCLATSDTHVGRGDFVDFCWLVATPAASQQHKKTFFLATSTLLQVPVPVPVLKIQVPVQVPVLCMQVPVPVPEKCT